MDIHEYQAKNLLKEFGIVSPDFIVLSTLDDVEKIPWDKAVLKVQVHAGGRGKAGGVKIAKAKDEIRDLAKQLLGMKIVNNQTGKKGKIARQIIASPLIEFSSEYYAACIIDRTRAKAFLIVSVAGGTEIEEVAKNTPEKIFKLELPLNRELKRYELYPLVKFLGWNHDLAEKGITFFSRLIKAFFALDATLLEINPLVVSNDGEVLALDAKASIDDNALFRQSEIAKMYDPSQFSENEARANTHDLAYVGLDGDIGCMVNGAGLAMATMDLIQAYGKKPANFLDVGGGASKEKVAEGFKIILSDPNVKAIFVNIFGGIMNCETLAEGIISAAKESQISVPLIVRMEGTNVQQGKKKLEESSLDIIVAKDLEEAAEQISKIT